MRKPIDFEYVPKYPGHKIYFRFGRFEISLYFGTNTHPWGKVYIFSNHPDGRSTTILG